MIRRWAQLGGRRRGLLLEAIGTLAAASAALRLLPFARAVRFGSRPLADGQSGPVEGELADELRWAVEAAAKRMPWRAVCIQQGLALQRMLRRRGVDAQLHYGVGHGDQGELQAHVWVAADDRVIIGGEQAPRFRRLASFP